MDNLINQDELTEASMLEALVQRFKNESIYTYFGEVLTSVNPYRAIPGLYTSEVARQYAAASPERTDGALLEQRPPHLFGVAELAFRRTLTTGRRQALIISGESGAGKTEATKLLLFYFARRAARSSQSSLGLEAKVMDASPVLEAFGNARTVRNKNSSRFGKLIELQLSPLAAIERARISQFLLEKSRVVHQSPGERNYHVFYYLCAGANAELQVELGLKSAAGFEYLRQGGDAAAAEAAGDARQFAKLQEALVSVGIPRGRQVGLWRLLAGLLQLGQVRFADFTPTTPRDGAGAPVRGGSNDKFVEACQLRQGDGSREALHEAARLLGVSPESLEEHLTTRMVVMPGSEPFRAPLRPADSLSIRDGTAKALYAGLFTWLLDTINASIFKGPSSLPSPRQSNRPNNHNHNHNNPDQGQPLTIGILDIFGFEAFETNSFEQLCINWANERLNEHFMRHVVFNEMAEYQKQGVECPAPSSSLIASRADCLELLEARPLGFFSLLDEEARFPSATDQSFLTKLFQQHLGRSRHLDRVRTDPNRFSLSHFAGAVAYSVDGLLDKNRDSLPLGFHALFSAASFDFLRTVLSRDSFTSTVAPIAAAVDSPTPPRASLSSLSTSLSSPSIVRGNRKQTGTLGSAFRTQLQGLSDMLEGSQNLYVRCIKPNENQSPVDLNLEGILRQLRYSGLLSACIIRKEGFPARFVFSEFLRRYSVLSPIPSSISSSPSVPSLLNHLNLNGSLWRVGTSKLFLKIAAAQQLETLRNAALSHRAVAIQTRWRGFVARRGFLRARASAMLIQQAFRRYAHREHQRSRHRAATFLQSHVRRWLAQKLFQQLLQHRCLEQQRQRAEIARRIELEARAAALLEEQRQALALVEDRLLQQQHTELLSKRPQLSFSNLQQPQEKATPPSPPPAESNTAWPPSLTTRLARRAERLATQPSSDALLPERIQLPPRAEWWRRLVDLPPSGVVRAFPSPHINLLSPRFTPSYPEQPNHASPSDAVFSHEYETDAAFSTDFILVERLQQQEQQQQEQQQQEHPRQIVQVGRTSGEASSRLRVAGAGDQLLPAANDPLVESAYSWPEYVRTNFNKQRPTGFGFRRKPWLSVDALSRFSLQSLPLPLLRQITLMDTPKNRLSATAQGLFQSLCHFMDDSGKKRLPSDSSLRRFIKSALGLALATAPLRNELHAWLIKLTSPLQQPQLASLPPAEHATPLRQIRAVQMLTICCCCFLPEDSALTNVLRSHVARVEAADDIMLEQLQCSLEQMLASVVGRTLPPSLAEAQAILECRTAATPVHVTSFTVKTCMCDSFTTVHDLISMTLDLLDLPERVAAHFGIDHEYAVPSSAFLPLPQPSAVRHLNSSTLVADHLAKFEIDQLSYPESLRVESRFTLRRRIFSPFPVELSTRQSETHRELLYHQLSTDVETGRVLLWGYQDLRLFACVVALKRQVERGDFCPAFGEELSPYLLLLQRLHNLARSVPALLSTRPGFKPSAAAAPPSDRGHRDLLAVLVAECSGLFGADRRDCEDAALAAFMALPFFGYHAFDFQVWEGFDLEGSSAKRVLQHDKRVILALSAEGVSLLSVKHSAQLYAVPFHAVEHYAVDAADSAFEIAFAIPHRTRLRLTAKPKVFEDFLPVFLHFWNYYSSASPYARALQEHPVSERTMLPFYRGDLIRITKRYLGSSWLEGYVLTLASGSQPPAGSRVGIFPSNLVLLVPERGSFPTHSASLSPTSSTAEVSTASTTTASTFAFSPTTKTPLIPLSLAGHVREPIVVPFLAQSLPSELHTLAVEMFCSVMQFMGDFPCLHEEPPASLAQYLIDSVLSCELLSDELLFQICAQLTNHPDRDHAICGFQLLALCLGVLVPTRSVVVSHRIQQLLHSSPPHHLHHAIFANDRWKLRKAFDERFPHRHRANPPSLLEFEACLGRTSIPVPIRRFSLPSSVSTHCSSLTSISAVIAALVSAPHDAAWAMPERGAVADPELDSLWGLFVVSEQQQPPSFQRLDPGDFLADALFMMERKCPLGVLELRRTAWRPSLFDGPSRRLPLSQLHADLLVGLRIPSDNALLVQSIALWVCAQPTAQPAAQIETLCRSVFSTPSLIDRCGDPVTTTTMISQVLELCANSSRLIADLPGINAISQDEASARFCRLMIATPLQDSNLPDAFSFEAPSLDLHQDRSRTPLLMGGLSPAVLSSAFPRSQRLSLAQRRARASPMGRSPSAAGSRDSDRLGSASLDGPSSPSPSMPLRLAPVSGLSLSGLIPATAPKTVGLRSRFSHPRAGSSQSAGEGVIEAPHCKKDKLKPNNSSPFAVSEEPPKQLKQPKQPKQTKQPKATKPAKQPKPPKAAKPPKPLKAAKIQPEQSKSSKKSRPTAIPQRSPAVESKLTNVLAGSPASSPPAPPASVETGFALELKQRLAMTALALEGVSALMTPRAQPPSRLPKPQVASRPLVSDAQKIRASIAGPGGRRPPSRRPPSAANTAGVAAARPGNPPLTISERGRTSEASPSHPKRQPSQTLRHKILGKKN